MSDNPSFVLRGIEDVVYEQRPIPDGQDRSSTPLMSWLMIISTSQGPRSLSFREEDRSVSL